jgi:anti-anti-sigma regulatory factor
MSKLKQTEFHKILPADLKKDTLVVSPAGDAISFREGDLNKEIKSLFEVLDEPGVKNLVVDLGTSRYYGTIIVGAFNALGMKIREAGGKIALCNASDDMRGILRVMNLDKIWPHYDSLKEALKTM